MRSRGPLVHFPCTTWSPLFDFVTKATSPPSREKAGGTHTSESPGIVAMTRSENGAVGGVGELQETKPKISRASGRMEVSWG